MPRKARPSDFEKTGFTQTKSGRAGIPGREKNTCAGSEVGKLGMLRDKR